MSAFVVDKPHIDALIQAGLSGNPWCRLSWYWDNPTRSARLEYDTADEVGVMLWAENVRSVQGRYPDTIESGEYPGPIDFADEDVFAYTFPTNTRTLTPVEALKALACYEYQSCEHEGWKASQAFAFCQSLRDELINRLPGYAEAAWSVSA